MGDDLLICENIGCSMHWHYMMLNKVENMNYCVHSEPHVHDGVYIAPQCKLHYKDGTEMDLCKSLDECVGNH